MNEDIDPTKVVVGSRWEDMDERQGNRVIRIVKAPTLSAPAQYVVEVAERWAAATAWAPGRPA